MDLKPKTWYEKIVEWFKSKFFSLELEIALVGL